MKDRRTIFWVISTIVIMVVVMVISYASAHSWYPQSCCAESHCHPVACDQLLEQPNGDVILSGTTIRVVKQSVDTSPDRFCHICIIAGSGVCAFIHYGT